MGSLMGLNFMWSGIDAYQNAQKAQASRLAALQEADSLDAEAAMKELTADEAQKRGALAMVENSLQGKAEQASATAGYAASGVRVFAGSAAAVRADMATWNEYERQKIEYETDLKSWGLDYEAAVLRHKADATRASAPSVGGSLLDTLVFSRQGFLTQGALNSLEHNQG